MSEFFIACRRHFRLDEAEPLPKRPPQWGLRWKSIWSYNCVLLVGNQYQTGSKNPLFFYLLMMIKAEFGDFKEEYKCDFQRDN